MKVKSRKSACKVSAKEQPVLSSPRKRRDEINSLDARKTAATALITSSSKKRRAGARLASTARVLRRSKMTKGSSSRADGVLVIDTCHDLRLAFSSLDGASSDHKGVSTTLDTIFSPVFHLFKGLNSSVELADSADEKAEDAEMRSEGQRDVDSGSDVCDNASTESGWVADSCLTPAAEHAHSIDEEVLGTQAAFDVGANCMEWSLEVENRDPVQTAEHMDDGIFDSEGSSLYLAVQQTKALDGSNEMSQAEVTADDGDLDEFDPYLFIKHLPDLSEVGRLPVLLPKQTRHCPPITLVLDLDGWPLLLDEGMLACSLVA